MNTKFLDATYIEKVPLTFFSDETGEPFRNCFNCERTLSDKGIFYCIEKAIKRYPAFDSQDTIFEHALCVDCQVRLHQFLSKESRQLISNFIASNVDFAARKKDLMQSQKPDLEQWLSTCIVTGNHVSSESEYQIYCLCHGDSIVFDLMPFMVSGSAINQMQKLLSQQTRDQLDHYMGNFFSLPPELKPLDKPIMFF